MFLFIYILGGQFNVVSAHATLEKAQPANSEVISESPHHIHLEMSEPVNAAYSKITLYNDQGKAISDIKPNTSGFSKTLTYDVDDLTEGTYLVQWETIAQDGHDMQGKYLFSVGKQTATSIDTTQPLLSDVSFWWGAMRFLLQSLLLTLVGLYLVNRIMEREDLPTHPILPKYHSVTTILLMVTLGTGILYLMTLPQPVIHQILSLDFTVWLQFPFVFSIVALMLLLTLFALRNMETIWYDIMPFLIMIAMAISGHVWSQTVPIYSIVIRMIHLIGISLWLGSLLYLVLYVLARHRHSYVPILRALLFKLNVTAVLMIIISGILMTIDQTTFSKLLGHLTLYSTLWYTKVIVTTIMMGLGSYQTFKVMKSKKKIHQPILFFELALGIILILAGVIMSQIEIL